MSVFQKLHITFVIIMAVGWMLGTAGTQTGSENAEQLGACAVLLSFLGMICTAIWWVWS